MGTDDLAARIAGIAALADPIRRDLYLHVSAEPDPVSTDQAAAALGIARHTVKFHLDKLVDEGLLDVDFKRLTERRGPGAGRPTKLYRLSGRELSLTLPERRYDLAGDLLARAIEDVTGERSVVTDAVNAAAAEWGRMVGDRARVAAGPRSGRAQLVDATCDSLAEQGYQPRRDGATITLSNCPFDALATKHLQLICGMNLAIMCAVTGQVSRSRLEARLEPAPDRCCVVLEVGGSDPASTARSRPPATRAPG
jgi:predicted ArsR family transcriptional regulator